LFNILEVGFQIYLCLAKKRSHHEHSQGLEITTLIKKTHHWHYKNITLKYTYTYF
jgi:hypothetical protein